MRAAGPRRQYLNSTMSLQSLIAALGRGKGVRYVDIRHGTDALRVENRAGGALMVHLADSGAAILIVKRTSQNPMARRTD